MSRPKKKSTDPALTVKTPSDSLSVDAVEILGPEDVDEGELPVVTPESHAIDFLDDEDFSDVASSEGEEFSEVSRNTNREDDSDGKDSTNYSPARQTPLDIYLREVQKIPLLSKEEERALALRYVKDKDLTAAKSLVQSNLWLVIKIARDYQNAARNLLDLIQEGNMGLMEAVKHYDPLREVRLPSYAAWWIKAYIIRYLIANFRMVKIGTTQAQRKLFFNLKKEKEKLERQGYFPAPKLLAEKLQVRESDVIEMEQRLGSADVSVDMPLNDNPEADLLSVIPHNQDNAEQLLAKQQIQQKIKENFDRFEVTLNEKEKAIFRERLLSDEKATLQELSDRFSISKERIRQIEERLLSKLKVFLADKLDPLEI